MPVATTDPGLLPQTTSLPSAHSAQFDTEMGDLWQAFLTGNAGSAGPAFFPESAYLQVKKVASPASDYAHRLLYEFDLDIAAAHRLVSSEGPGARLVSVDVPSQHAHWVPPGVCYNAVGYYEVANSRIVYEVGGQVRSFGVASMISWRGTWYVVHLGAVVRSTDVGIVEDPSLGIGTSAPSSTC